MKGFDSLKMWLLGSKILLCFLTVARISFSIPVLFVSLCQNEHSRDWDGYETELEMKEITFYESTVSDPKITGCTLKDFQAINGARGGKPSQGKLQSA